MLFSFRTVVALFGVCATIVSAQNGAQSTAAAYAILSYYESLETQSAFLSLVSDLSTNTAWPPIESSISSLIAHGQTPTSGFVAAFPTEAQPVFSSIYSVEASILAANGFKTANAAMPTGRAMVGAAAGAAAGFVGVIIAV